MKCTGCNTDIPIGQRVQVIDTLKQTGEWMDIYCYLNLNDETRYVICETSSRKANGDEIPF